jgi:outer membrane protein TolC
MEVNSWAKAALNKYYYFFEQIKLYNKNREQLKEVARIQQLKYESGRLSINDLITTQSQIADIQSKLDETKLQVFLFRYEIRSQALFDVKDFTKIGM